MSVLEIGVQNISTMPYGDSPGSGGRIFVQLHLVACLIPVGSANINTSSELFDRHLWQADLYL